MGRSKFLLALATGAVAMLLIPAPLVGARVADSGRLDDAIRFRTDFGLQADSDFVENTFVDGRFDDTAYSVPLSAAEVDDLTRRAVMRELFQPLLEAALKDPTYAGAYIDQNREGLPVLLSSSPDTFAAALGADPSSQAPHEVIGVTYSYHELLAIQQAVEATAGDLKRHGTDVVSVGLNIRDNRVVVGVNGSNGTIQDALQAQFGPAVRVREDSPSTFDACTNMTSCWPMKGGLKIRMVSQTGFICTSGFTVEKTTTGALGTVTAGHCLALKNPPGTDYWGHASTPAHAVNFGSELLNTWYDNSDADVGLIIFDLDTVADLGFANDLHVADPSTTGTVTGEQASVSQLVGDAVCRMGWGTWNDTGQGRTCGTVGPHINVSHESCESGMTNCWTILHTWEVSFDSLPGDSGGPIYRQTTPPQQFYKAYGTHVHSGSGAGAIGWYSPIDWGRAEYFQASGSQFYTYAVCVTQAC